MNAHFFNKGPYIMGILNVTPDSFFDGGLYGKARAAVEHGFRLAEEGADIIDIGGESTRPGAPPVSAQEEIDRVLPVIEGLKNCGKLISVDTRNAATMIAALAAGAGMINDVSALRHDADSLRAAAAAKVPVCLMHMQGDPQSMQKAPQYDDVVKDVFDFLNRRIAACEATGIDRSLVVADPGIGFGKTFEHNMEILRNIAQFRKLDVPILVGVSRKSVIGRITGEDDPARRAAGSVAAALWCLRQGASLFRVHDVAQTKQAFRVASALE
ncbi:MAG: dihydropteroate synthase [Proteobacteria bacterium]|nr:dihydropteroate synthase [Pseudomonadota bacterium]